MMSLSATFGCFHLMQAGAMPGWGHMRDKQTCGRTTARSPFTHSLAQREAQPLIREEEHLGAPVAGATAAMLLRVFTRPRCVPFGISRPVYEG